MKIKTGSGIRKEHFQEEKEYDSWFKNLFKVAKSMDNCQRGCAIEPDTSTSCNSSDFTSEDNLNKSTATASKKRPPFLPLHETTKKAKKRHIRKIQK